MIAALEARDDARLAEVIQHHLDQTWLRVVEKI